MKKENKKILIATFLTFTLTSLFFISIILNIKIEDKKIFKEQNKVNNKSFAIMVESGNGYVASDDDVWPIGYKLNEELTNCIDNSGTKIENVLNYDNGQVSMKSNKNLFCYLYFDLGTPLYDKIMELSPTGLVKSYALTNDTLYRFTSTSNNVNNYICLGTTNKCESGTENMYRIIGVEPSTGYVKIIKQTILNGTTYAWHSSTGVTWLNSSLFGIIQTYYNSQSFKSMIASHTWGLGYVGSGKYNNKSSVLTAELTSTGTAYVGALALSDYYLAYTTDQNWNSNYNKNNWLHLSNNGYTSNMDWTMTSWDNSSAWQVSNLGGVGRTDMTYTYAVRPVFYLSNNVIFVKGSGTINDPFIVAQ